MNLFTKQKVVKSYAIAVAGPCLVDCQFPEFQGLTDHLTVLTAEKDEVNDQFGDIQYPLQYPLTAQPGSPDAYEEVSILRQAEAEAAEIIRRAEIQAFEVLQNGENELENKRRELEAQVRSEIEPQAYAEGYQKGFNEGAATAGRIREKALGVLQLANKALEAEYEKVDEQLLRLAVRIAERVTRANLKVKPEMLLQIARSLTLLPQEKDGWLLHVAPGDVLWLKDIEMESLPCPWVEDDTLQTGDCFLESREGIHDARIEEQLSKLEQALLEELKHGELEPDGPEDS